MKINASMQSAVIFLVFISGLLAIAFVYSTDLNWVIWLAPIWVGVILPLLHIRFRKYAGLIAVRIGIPIIISIVVWGSYRMVIQSQFFGAYSRQLYTDWNTITVALDIFATLHALVFAFCLWKAMEDFDSLKNCLRDEANKIMSITALLRYFDNVNKGKNQKSLKAIRKNLNNYTKNIARDVGDNSNTQNAGLLTSCIDNVEYLEMDKKIDEVALEGVVQNFAELIMLRSRRMSFHRNSLSPFLVVIIGIMSAAVIFMFFVRNPVGFNSNEFIIPTLTFVYAYLLVMLIDLDHPFDGFWKVSLEAFEGLDKPQKSMPTTTLN